MKPVLLAGALSKFFYTFSFFPSFHSFGFSKTVSLYHLFWFTSLFFALPLHRFAQLFYFLIIILCLPITEVSLKYLVLVCGRSWRHNSSLVFFTLSSLSIIVTTFGSQLYNKTGFKMVMYIFSTNIWIHGWFN